MAPATDSPATLRTRARACAAIVLASFLSSAALATEGGYASEASVAQGESIDFHISTKAPTYSLRIYREGEPRLLMREVDGLPGTDRACPAGKTGCAWDASYTLDVPQDWPSGLYIAEFDVDAPSEYTPIRFVVREDQPGSASKILLVLPTNTDVAYSHFDGRSLYAPVGAPAVTVSYDRPTAEHGDWQEPLIRWAEAEGFVIEYATDVDFHAAPELLPKYSCFMTAGHSEYWSWEMRDHLDAFVNQGGNALILGGNTSWWQIRFSEDGRSFTSYKERAPFDPFNLDGDPSNNHLITTRWESALVNRPVATSIGISFRYGGFHNFTNPFVFGERIFAFEDGFGGYRVYRTNDWVFDGTNLKDGDMLGRDATIVGYETDGTLLEARTPFGTPAWDSRSHYPLPGALPYVVNSFISKTPPDFVVLGVAPASDGYAVMGRFERPGGGRVFNAGTTDWSHGLVDDANVQAITRNVMLEYCGPGPDVEPTGSSDTMHDQTPAQQACINALNGDFAKLARAHAKANAKCLKNRASKGASAATCLSFLDRGVKKARDKARANAERRCAGAPPDFGPVDANLLSQAATWIERTALSDLFGSNLDDAIVTQSSDKTAAKCQQAAIKAIQKCQVARIAAFNACKKTALKSGAATSAKILASCLGSDSKGGVAKACDPETGPLAAKVLPKSCGGVDLAAVFPACGTADPAELAGHVDHDVSCRVCFALSVGDRLGVDCDLFDDGQPNASCP